MRQPGALLTRRALGCHDERPPDGAATGELTGQQWPAGRSTMREWPRLGVLLAIGWLASMSGTTARSQEIVAPAQEAAAPHASDACDRALAGNPAKLTCTWGSGGGYIEAQELAEGKDAVITASWIEVGQHKAVVEWALSVAAKARALELSLLTPGPDDCCGKELEDEEIGRLFEISDRKVAFNLTLRLGPLRLEDVHYFMLSMAANQVKGSAHLVGLRQDSSLTTGSGKPLSSITNLQPSRLSRSRWPGSWARCWFAPGCWSSRPEVLPRRRAGRLRRTARR